jgi:hypothetical protein
MWSAWRRSEEEGIFKHVFCMQGLGLGPGGLLPLTGRSASRDLGPFAGSNQRGVPIPDTLEGVSF